MKRWMKRAAALLLCAVTAALAGVSGSAGTGPAVYFMAVNDVPLELTAADMPTTVGGVLYVPYFMLSANTTGVNLGVYAVYNPSQGRALVYSNRKQLIFDLQENTTYDMDGNTYPERAMRRNSTVYIPIARVCDVFSDVIWYTRSATPYGYLVRVKNASVVLSDEAFIAAASNRMRENLDRYLQSRPAQDPVPSESPKPIGSGAGVYLAFTLGGEDGWEQGLNRILEALDRQDCQGLFFLTPAELAEHDDLVRRLVGLGHLVGARLTVKAPDDALSGLAEARAYMAEIARCRLTLALAELPEGGETEALEQAGAVLWRTTVDGRDLTGTGANRAAALLRRLTPGETARNCLLLDAGAGETLETVLTTLREEEFQFRPPVPTELGNV